MLAFAGPDALPTQTSNGVLEVNQRDAECF